MENSLSLSSLITLLLRNTLDGIISSELENHQKIQEIKNSITLSDEEFAKQFITLGEIREQILFTFPTNTLNVSSIDRGQKYVPIAEGVSEYPPIKKELDYDMLQEDYESKGNEFVITQEGYQHLFLAMQKRYVKEKKILIKQLLFKGVPNVYVDRGELTSKVYLSPNSLEGLLCGYEKGILYKCYNEWNPTEFYLDRHPPYAQGICKQFDWDHFSFTDAKMIVFEGYISITTSDCYHFKLHTKEQCILELNHQLLLSDKKETSIIYLKQGIYPFRIKCSYHQKENLFSLYYSTSQNNHCQILQPLDLYHKIDNSHSFLASYKNKNVQVDVLLPSLQGELDSGLGELKLFYHFVHE